MFLVFKLSQPLWSHDDADGPSRCQESGLAKLHSRTSDTVANAQSGHGSVSGS